MSVLFTPAGLTCCPLQLITPSWPWEGWPGVPSPLHPPSPSYYQIQPEGAECSVLTILTGKIGQVEPLVSPPPPPLLPPPLLHHNPCQGPLAQYILALFDLVWPPQSTCGQLVNL